MGRDGNAQSIPLIMRPVSIHAPVWGATDCSWCTSVINRFNPRARVGRDLTRISITQQQLAVSIHAPVWGATIAIGALGLVFLFQSTRPCGARRGPAQRCHEHGVSIHAPVWGATTIKILLFSLLTSFNPRARVGRDAVCCPVGRFVTVSIHAPVWGAT